MNIIGIIFMLTAIGGLCWVFFKMRPSKSIEPVESLPSDTETRSDNKLKVLCSGQSVTLLGEGEKQVIAVATFHEMTQMDNNAPWTETGSASRALVLSGGIFIFKMPSREGGKPIWLRAEEIDTLPLGPFYLGSQENPGPGRKFYQKNQAVPITYTLPNDLTPGVVWQVVDIGTLKVEVGGESDNFQNRDILYFVTSNEKGGNRRLLYLDARKGEARGTGGTFFCEPFEPSVDITDIL